MERIRLTNKFDENLARTGGLDPADVRSLDVDFLVDTGATMLMVPADLVERLGLPIEGQRTVRYADGRLAEVPWVAGLKIEVRGRVAVCDALVEAKGTTPLLGQIPLEELDFVVDPKSRQLLPNPANPDAPVMDAMVA